MSGSEHLVHMANDIGNFFRGNTDRQAAVVSISNHIKSFWTPRMRRKLISDMHGGDEELDELPREALRLLQEHPDFKPRQLPEGNAEGGGDAG
jgi:formate dehydrogenase subunit delta